MGFLTIILVKFDCFYTSKALFNQTEIGDIYLLAAHLHISRETMFLNCGAKIHYFSTKMKKKNKKFCIKMKKHIFSTLT